MYGRMQDRPINSCTTSVFHPLLILMHDTCLLTCLLVDYSVDKTGEALIILSLWLLHPVWVIADMISCAFQIS